MAIRLKDQVNLSTGLRNGESVLGEHAVHGSYYGLWNTEAISGTTQQYLIISAGTDTYINGDNVYIRAGNNSTTNQLKVTTSGTTIGGNTVWHAGNDGASSGLDADTVDGIQGGSFLRSDADDSFSGNLTSGDNGWIKFYAAEQTDSNDGKIGSGVFDTGLNIVGAQTSAGTGRQIRLWGSVIDSSGNAYWHAGNDGSGTGLDADLLDGVQGASYLRSDDNDTYNPNNAAISLRLQVDDGSQIASGGSSQRFPLEVFANNGTDAAITFHISSDYAGYFGLDGATNDLHWGGWSVGGSTKYRILHTGNYSSWNRDDRYYTESEIDTKLGGKDGNNSGAFGMSKKIDFYVYGDDDKYYPVIIDGGNASVLKRYQIYRGYSEAASNNWNTSTHRGSLTLDYEMRVGGWGGYTNMYHVNYFGEQYSRQCAKLAYANHTMQHVVWLRGGGSGGAIYHIESSANISVSVYDNTSASNYVNGSGWRTYDNSNDAYDTYYDYLSVGSTADAQTQSTIINHMLVKANSAVNESSGGGTAPGLNATTLDGVDSSQFVRSDADDSLSGQYSFTKTNDHAIKVGTIRGTAVGSQSGEYIHMYERVHIGGPSGWGASNAAAPSQGLSVYGQIQTNHIRYRDSSSGIRLGNFGTGNADETGANVVTFLRDGGFDNYIIKGSTSRGVYGREFIGQHFNSNKSWGVFSSGWDTHLQISGDDRIYLKPNVGIGLTSPGSPLHVSGDIETSAGSIRISDNWGQGFYSAEQLSIIGSYPSLTFRNNSQDHKWLVHHDGGSKLQFYEGADWDSNSWTKRMTFQNGTSGIDAYRFRDIENTAYYVEPASTSNLSGLTVANNITGRINGLADRGFGDTELTFYQDSGAFGSQWSSGWASHIVCNHGNGSNYYNQIIHMPFWGPPQYSRMQGNTSSIAGRYDFCTNEASFTTTHTIQAGTLRATSDVIAYYSSDKRLKDNIIPIGNAIDKIKQISGYEFDWNDKQENFEGHDYGVIAQEVEKVLPELVKDREDGYKGVRYEKLTSVLIQGIKEQQDTIENQQKQIDELKDLVNQLINK